jgi:L-lactate dehydrogenase complex protein LldE
MPDIIGDRSAPRVGLFVTCLVDAMRPQIGFAAIQLLEEAGCVVEVPDAQTCCGQPAFNSGDTGRAAALPSTTAGIYWFEYAVSSGCAVPVAGAAFASATKR